MKIINSSLVLSLVLALPACGSSGGSDSKNQDVTPVPAAVVSTPTPAAVTGDADAETHEHAEGEIAEHTHTDSATVDPAAPVAAGSATVSEKGLYNVYIAWSEHLEAGTLANSAKLHFHDASGAHADVILKSFKLYMTSMGHGSIKESSMVFTKAENDPGHWQVANIYFSMPGAAQSWAADIVGELNGQTDKVRVVIDAEVL